MGSEMEIQSQGKKRKDIKFRMFKGELIRVLF